jgi:DNA-binding transcriptional regulator YhcF (GntR family)
MAAEQVRHDGRDGPLWKQIEAALLQQVKDGRFKGNGRLPSEFDLAEEFGVNRHTARQAIAALVQRGVLFKRKGGGSYVVPEMLDYEIGERTRFSTNVAAQGREPAHTLIVVDERPAHGKAAETLNMAEGDLAVFISLIGEADDIPISVAETYVSGFRGEIPGKLLDDQGFGALRRDRLPTRRNALHRQDAITGGCETSETVGFIAGVVRGERRHRSGRTADRLSRNPLCRGAGAICHPPRRFVSGGRTGKTGDRYEWRSARWSVA